MEMDTVCTRRLFLVVVNFRFPCSFLPAGGEVDEDRSPRRAVNRDDRDARFDNFSLSLSLMSVVCVPYVGNAEYTKKMLPLASRREDFVALGICARGRGLEPVLFQTRASCLSPRATARVIIYVCVRTGTRQLSSSVFFLRR